MMFATPDITKAQIVAVVAPILAALAAFGIDLSDAQQQAILGLAGVVALVLPLADAIIRHGRATGNAQKGAETSVVVTDEQVHKAVAGVISQMAATSKANVPRGKATE